MLAMQHDEFLADSEASEVMRRPASIMRRKKLLDEILARRAETGAEAVVGMLIGSPQARELLVPAHGQPKALDLTPGESAFLATEEARITRRRDLARPTPAFVLRERPWLLRSELNKLIQQGHLKVLGELPAMLVKDTVVLERKPLEKLTEGRVMHWRINGNWPRHDPSPRELEQTRERQARGKVTAGPSGPAKGVPKRK